MRAVGSWLTRGKWQPRTRRPASGDLLFRGLRLRLTLWYSGVLAASLLLAGIGLYLVLQHQLLQPITDQVSGQIDSIEMQWGHDPAHACSSPGGPPPKHDATNSPIPIYVTCYDPQGQILPASAFQSDSSSDAPDTFTDNSLALRALKDGSATDQVNGGANVGTLYRSAQVVRDPASGTILGVVQVGRSIEDQESTLSLLRTLLLALGLVALFIATVGGLFLAERALTPARLAFARQQAFIADASHELRTPLTLLRANAEMLLRHRERVSEDDADMLEGIVEETEHIDHLSTDLLLLARLDAGQLHLEREVVDLSSIAANVARRVGTMAGEKGVAVKTSESATVRIIGDAEAIERAVLILVDNAVKYTPSGGSVHLRTAIQDGMATLAVEDTGVGIDAAHLPHLTERFYRVDRARSRETGGAGLGLSIAQGIAAAHGGSLTITSEPEKGTIVRLMLLVNGPGSSTALTPNPSPTRGEGL
jgi:signal transduction histidine kinase